MTWERLGDIRPIFNRFPVGNPPQFHGRHELRPVAAFTLVNSSVTNLTIQATDNSYTPFGGNIINWAWDFGDGSTSTLSSPAHTYADPGTYLVTLRVTNDSGLADSESAALVQQYVDPPNSGGTITTPPVSLFTWTQASSTVTFTDLSTYSTSSIVGWFWNFGEIPTSAFSYVLSGTTVTFLDQSSDVSPGSVTTWAWTFGDGSSSTVSSPTHTYTNPGTYPVTLTVTDSDGNTAQVGQTVTITSGGTVTGRPFGPMNFWTGSNPPTTGAASFTASLNYMSPSILLDRLSSASSLGHRFLTAMTGGAHSNYLTSGRFDFNKWKAVMDGYNTPALKDAVAVAVANGTLLGNSVMDEPNHPSWGGVMTKSLIDSMCSYVKSIFSTLPCGVVVTHDWRPTERYTVCDFVVDQYWPYLFGSDITAFRTAGLNQAALDGVQICFSFNALDGGDLISGCPIPQTGGTGTFGTHCRVNAQQFQDFGLQLGPAGVGLLFWQYDTTMMSQSSYQAAASAISAALTPLPRQSWRRSS